MLRKCAAALAVSLVCLSGQAYAQQVTAKATTSAVERVGARSGQSNDFAASPWLMFVIFGVASTALIISANEDDDSPVSN